MTTIVLVAFFVGIAMVVTGLYFATRGSVRLSIALLGYLGTFVGVAAIVWAVAWGAIGILIPR